MNPRVTGVLFLVAAALAAFVYFYEIRGETERRAAEEAEKRLFSGVVAADVDAIQLTASDGVGVRAERREAGWQLVAPLEFPADAFAFDAMASALADLTSETAIEDPQEPAVYGLDVVEREVRFTAGGSEHVLRLGDKTPVGSNTYVAVVGSPGVYTVPSYRVNAFSRTLLDLRDRRVLDFDREAVKRIEARWPGGGVVLERGADGWRLLQPLSGPADDETVATLLSDLGVLRATGFVDDPSEDQVAGFDQPAFAVRLSGAGGGEGGVPFDVGFSVADHPDGDSRLVRGEQASLYQIDAERLDDFPTDVVAYRFKQLADFDAAGARSLEILFHAAIGESVAIHAERGEGGWISTPEAFAAGKLDGVVAALETLRARDIAAESMGQEELAGVGLAPPDAVYVVRGPVPPDAAADATAPVLAEVEIGRIETGRGIFARKTGQDTVYLLDAALAEHLPVSYEAFENRFRAEPATAEGDAGSPAAAGE